MAGTADNVRVWLGADVYSAPLGTTGPTDLTAAWAAAWLPLGLLATDGLTIGRDENMTEHFAWGAGLVRRTRTQQRRMFGVIALEENPVVRALKNPGSTVATLTGVDTHTIKPSGPNIRAFGFELLDGTVKRRIIIPRGEAFMDGEETANEESMFQVSLNIEAYTSNGAFYTELVPTPV